MVSIIKPRRNSSARSSQLPQLGEGQHQAAPATPPTGVAAK